MNGHEELCAYARQAIEGAAAFSLLGMPRAFMELEDVGGREGITRWIYQVYGYGVHGVTPRPAMDQLVKDMIRGIRGVARPRVAVVWRRYPQIDYDEENERYYASMRLVVVDEEWQPMDLDLNCLKAEGVEYRDLSEVPKG